MKEASIAPDYNQRYMLNLYLKIFFFFFCGKIQDFQLTSSSCQTETIPTFNMLDAIDTLRTEEIICKGIMVSIDSLIDLYIYRLPIPRNLIVLYKMIYIFSIYTYSNYPSSTILLKSANKARDQFQHSCFPPQNPVFLQD